MEREFNYLKRKPKIQGVNGIIYLPFFVKKSGEKDARENQVCEMENGHITPYISKVTKLYNSYINKVYGCTTSELEKLVKEISKLSAELDLMLKDNLYEIKAVGEEAQRQIASMEARYAHYEKRKPEIITRLAEIKSIIEMVDEMMQHHVERARDIFESHISMYWRGVLKVSDVKLEHFPYIEDATYASRELYNSNINETLRTINNSLSKGGYIYEE
ncbi:MAG: hypothetical protein J6A59_18040, partial [Lachnospiraceae bacterium]|nr:hypothetical protein [Lachnospiraceae bacterium]